MRIFPLLISSLLISCVGCSPPSPQDAVELLGLTATENRTARITVLGTNQDGPFLIDFVPDAKRAHARAREIGNRLLISTADIGVPTGTDAVVATKLAVSNDDGIDVVAQGETRGRLLRTYAADEGNGRVVVFLTQPTSEF